MRSVTVIGGGASGLIAAISAARCGAHATVLEAGDRVGQKILKTGNGRCNLTNMNMKPEAYNAPAFVAPVLESYGPERVRMFFEQLGLLTYEEREGRVYPASNTANTVLDTLRLNCAAMGVDVVCNFEAVDINRRSDGYVITGGDGTIRKADAVVVATGGGSDLLSMCGHTILPFRPVLCALKTQTERFRGLSGVRVHAKVNMYDMPQARKPYASEVGEVLFREYGLSGIVIFNMSRIVEEGHTVSLDLLPEMGVRKVKTWLDNRYQALTEGQDTSFVPTNEDLLLGMFHPRVGTCVLRAAKCKPSRAADPSAFTDIAKCIKGLRTTVLGTADPRNSQVTRGGVLTDEVNPKTLESRKASELYVAGEVLNVDGRCGGYNLHWAWASGIVAGYNAAHFRLDADNADSWAQSRASQGDATDAADAADVESQISLL